MGKISGRASQLMMPKTTPALASLPHVTDRNIFFWKSPRKEKICLDVAKVIF